jgi:hypothetical protein
MAQYDVESSQNGVAPFSMGGITTLPPEIGRGWTGHPRFPAKKERKKW